MRRKALILLQLVNRYELYFYNLTKNQNLHPEAFYQICLQLVGELATFTKDTRRSKIITYYRHDDLNGTFKPIFEELRRSLSMVLEQSATAINLKQHQHGIWIGTVNDKELLNSSALLLSV